MSHSMLLDRSQSNVTITASNHHHHNTPKMNGNAVQISHRQPISSGILDSSKHSIGTVTGSTGSPLQLANHNATICGSPPSPVITRLPYQTSKLAPRAVVPGINHTLASLALMCICSLFLSLVALLFLQNIEPEKTKVAKSPDQGDKNVLESVGQYLISSDELITVYEVAICLATLVIGLDLCCLFVCSLQFLFASKLLLTVHGVERSSQFLHQCSKNRVVAISAFFISIPVFFTALILHSYIHSHYMPAVITSILLGIAILYCGLASIYNVYIWQSQKTRVVKSFYSIERSKENYHSPTTLDLTSTNMELSTLV